MNELVFDAIKPITEKGIVWDKYYLQSLTISTDPASSKVSMYAEFWLARLVTKEVFKETSRVISEKGDVITIYERPTLVPMFELKARNEGYQIESIEISDIYSDKSYPTELEVLTDKLINLLYKVGLDRGVFK
jgi:hypothetical protein